MLAATSELQEQVTGDLTLSYVGAEPNPEIMAEAYVVPGMSVLASIAPGHGSSTWEGSEKRGIAEVAGQPHTPALSLSSLVVVHLRRVVVWGPFPHSRSSILDGWPYIYSAGQGRKGPLGQGLA